MFPAVRADPVRDDRLQRRAGMAFGEVRAPVDIEAAVARQQRGHFHAAPGQQRNPGAVRPQLRPAAATQGQDRRCGAHATLAVGRVESQRRAVIVPSQPAVLDVEPHALVLQPAHPAAQQWCSLAVQREHPVGAAHVGLHAQAACPFAQVVGAEIAQPSGQRLLARAVASREAGHRFGMGQVEPAFAGDQELAPDRALALEHIDLDPGRTRDLGGHQSGRTAADDGQPGQFGRGSGRGHGVSAA